MYHTTVIQVCVPKKFDGTQGVKAEVFATYLGLFTITKKHLFLSDFRKPVFALLYLTGAERSWAQPMTQKLLEGACIQYCQFTQILEAMFFKTEKTSKAKKAIPALRNTRSMVMYTQKFNLHSHCTKWKAPKFSIIKGWRRISDFPTWYHQQSLSTLLSLPTMSYLLAKQSTAPKTKQKKEVNYRKSVAEIIKILGKHNLWLKLEKCKSSKSEVK